jgi:hypothetical protein
MFAAWAVVSYPDGGGGDQVERPVGGDELVE